MLAVLLGVLYFSAAKLGTLTLMAEGTAIVWLPNGIVLGFLLRYPERTAPFLMAAFAAELIADLPGFRLIEAISFGLINLGEALLARALLARVRFKIDFSEVTDVFRFLLIAPGAAALAAALLGGAVYSVFRGEHTSYLEFVRVWWFGDAVGLILATPLVLAAGRGLSADRLDRADICVCVLALLAVALLGFTNQGLLAGVHFGPIVLLPFVAYAATRFDTAVVSGLVIVAALIVVVMTAAERNPFGHRTAMEAVVHAQEFLSVMGGTALGLAAGTQQLRRVRRDVEMANATLERRVFERTRQLEDANAQVRTLSGLLPICAWCRKLRDYNDYWHSLEDYISRHTDAKLTHGICPDCAGRVRDRNES